MITSLYVKNVAVIKELNIDFNSGLSVLTGETGAGKSVIMDCIGILIGTRPIKGKIRYGEQNAVVQAGFDNLPKQVVEILDSLGYESNGEVVLQRNFNIEGKNQARLNGQPITQSMAKEIGSLLISIHGQNDNQRLLLKQEHYKILDSFADLDSLRNDYHSTYLEFKELQERLSVLKNQAREKARLYDVYMFQAKEIDEINPKCGEEEALIAEEKRLENIEKIQKHSQFTYHLLKGAERSAGALINKASSSISQLSSVIPEAADISERLIQIEYDLIDIAESVNSLGDYNGENADKKLDKIGSRLNSIAKLKRKYGNSIEEIIAFREKLAITLDEMDNSDDIINSIESKLNSVKDILICKGEELRKLRIASAKNLQNQIMNELEYLEMPKVRFIVNIASSDQPTPTGLDNIEFLISTNSGQEPMQMVKIASGGELSRIMLAIQRILLNKSGVTTAIFDEIDTGISGKTSRKVGIKLKQISKYIQVICVTHSAQIASLADNHYLISKCDVDGKTQTSTYLLDEASKINEVARILGGINVTENQILAATEMIEEGKLL